MTYSPEGIGNQYVVFGYKSVDRTVIRLASFKSPQFARLEAINNYGSKGIQLPHVGIAKVQYPQKIWFYKPGAGFIQVSSSLVFDIITLLGV